MRRSSSHIPQQRQQRVRTLALAALAALAVQVSLPRSAQADEPVVAESGDQKVTIEVRNARLGDLVIHFSYLTGENFVLLDQELEDRRINFYTPGPVTVEEACELFVTTLRLSGLEVGMGDSYWGIEP